MDTETLLILIGTIVIAVLAFVFAYVLYMWVRKQPSENKRNAKVGKFIKNGYNTFLRKEYTALAKFAGVIAIFIILLLPRPICQGNVLNNLIMVLAYVNKYFSILKKTWVVWILLCYRKNNR